MAGGKILDLLFLILAFFGGLVHLFPTILTALVSGINLFGITLQMIVGLLTVVLALMRLLPMFMKK